MFEGKLLAIYIAPTGAAAMQSVDQVRVVAGHGLEGDRYSKLQGTFSRPGRPEQQVTLIEQEALEAARRDYQLDLEGADTRRNLLTEGVPLNHLVGRAFQIYDVVLRGVELCEPCKHLQQFCGPEVIKALRHRGGLRAEILQGGMIRAGDIVRQVEQGK